MWTEPKTDWVRTDDIKYSDYNRIKNNIEYLRKLSLELFPDFPFEDMGDDKINSDYPFADEYNALEDNLESLRQNTFLFDDSNAKEWYDNMPTLTYEDFNRIESACLSFKNGFDSIKANKTKLSFRCGNTGFVKI